MSFSTSKQKKHATDFPLFIEDGAITQVHTAKSIGVYIDGTLTWTNHIKIIATKIAKNIGVIIRISHVISYKLRLNMYHTMVSQCMAYTGILYGHPTTNRELIALLSRKNYKNYWSYIVTV